MNNAHCYECHKQGNYTRDRPQLKRNKKEISANIVDVNSSVDVDSSRGDSSFGEVLSVSAHHGNNFVLSMLHSTCVGISVGLVIASRCVGQYTSRK